MNTQNTTAPSRRVIYWAWVEELNQHSSLNLTEFGKDRIVTAVENFVAQALAELPASPQQAPVRSAEVQSAMNLMQDITFSHGREKWNVLRDYIATLEHSPVNTAQPSGSVEDALKSAQTALNDWLATYAPEHMLEKDVVSANVRIKAAYGTLAYIADVQAKISAALTQPVTGCMFCGEDHPDIDCPKLHQTPKPNAKMVEAHKKARELFGSVHPTPSAPSAEERVKPKPLEPKPDLPSPEAEEAAREIEEKCLFSHYEYDIKASTAIIQRAIDGAVQYASWHSMEWQKTVGYVRGKWDAANKRADELLTILRAIEQHANSAFCGPNSQKAKDQSWRGVMRKVRKALAQSPAPTNEKTDV